MQRLEITASERYCRNWGERLDVVSLQRCRVGGLFSPRQWHVETVCPRCGCKGGFSWSTLTMGPSRSPARNPVTRLLLHVLGIRHTQRCRDIRARMQERHPYRRPDGGVDLALLLSKAPFPVYGLRGHPLGLSLRSPGWGGHGLADAMQHVHFGYVVGHPRTPTQVLDIDQGYEESQGGDPA